MRRERKKRSTARVSTVLLLSTITSLLPHTNFWIFCKFHKVQYPQAESAHFSCFLAPGCSICSASKVRMLGAFRFSIMLVFSLLASQDASWQPCPWSATYFLQMPRWYWAKLSLVVLLWVLHRRGGGLKTLSQETFKKIVEWIKYFTSSLYLFSPRERQTPFRGGAKLKERQLRFRGGNAPFSPPP